MKSESPDSEESMPRSAMRQLQILQAKLDVLSQATNVLLMNVAHGDPALAKSTASALGFGFQQISQHLHAEDADAELDAIVSLMMQTMLESLAKPQRPT